MAELVYVSNFEDYLLQQMYVDLSAWSYTRSSASQINPFLQCRNLQSPMKLVATPAGLHTF